MKDCLFCKIGRKEIPAAIVYEDEELVAFKDIAPQAPVHLLIIPKIHGDSLSDLPPEALAAASRIPALAARLAQEHGVAASGWRLLANTGPDGGQVVNHLHFHVIGGRPLGGRLCK